MQKRLALNHLVKPLKNQRGMALMLAIACMVMITFIAMEVIYDSRVEYDVNSQTLNRLKAFYAAKSGMQLSLLRIKTYQQVQTQYGSMLGSNAKMLDQIWQFPMAWPLPIPAELNAMDKDAFKKLTKESTMDAAYMTTIEDEGSKIDLNDLVSPSKTLAKITRQQILNIFEQKKLEDEVFMRAHSNVRFDELVNSMIDWMSYKSGSDNGGDKRSAYGDLNAETGTDYFPPNRPFRTIAELHMIPGMLDYFFDLLAPRVTLNGMKGINPNLATKDVLKSLDPGMTDEVVNAIVKRRDDKDEGGPFKDAQDFWGFVQNKGIRMQGTPEDMPLVFDAIMTFKIRSNGEFGGAAREIVVIVADLDRAATKIKEYVDKDAKGAGAGGAGAGAGGGAAAGGGKGGAGAAGAKKAELPKGPPRIVQWTER
jgi:general secretion pathway protein K